jgi:hypothetical protein
MTHAQLSLPTQAAPVSREPGWAVMGGGPGVQASDFWSDLWDTISPAIPGIIGGLTGLI